MRGFMASKAWVRELQSEVSMYPLIVYLPLATLVVSQVPVTAW